MKSPSKLLHLTAVVSLVGAAFVSGCGSSSANSSGASSADEAASASGLSLYERLGGKEGLEKFTTTVVDTKVLVDPELKSFFFNQVATPIPAGHPSKQQIIVCFARFVGAALKADSYPGEAVSDPSNTNTPEFTCRGMAESHHSGDTQLHIGAGTFDKFIGLIADSLKPLVVEKPSKAGEISQAEFDALASALMGQKEGVVTPGAAEAAGAYPN